MTYNYKVIIDLNRAIDEIVAQVEEASDRSAIFAFYIQIVDSVKKATEEELLEKLLKMILAEGVISRASEQEDSGTEEDTKKS